MLLVIATMMLISGCASGSRTSGWCQLNDPIFITEAEFNSLDRGNKEVIITHNEFGQKKCGWKPIG